MFTALSGRGVDVSICRSQSVSVADPVWSSDHESFTVRCEKTSGLIFRFSEGAMVDIHFFLIFLFILLRIKGVTSVGEDARIFLSTL